MILAALLGTCLLGTAPYTTPRTTCTPGAYQPLTRQQACTPRDRPSLPAAERRWILRRYKLVAWTGQQGELDHRVPFFLGGTTDHRNVWPEAGPIPNPKDRFETFVYGRVCRSRTMTARYARRLFLVDWRLGACRYGLITTTCKELTP